MTIWILALLLLAAGVGMGLKQGAIRASFSFLGIVLGGLLAVPVGNIFKPLLPHIGVHNPAVVWMAAPPVAFVLVLAVFKMAGHFVHRKVGVHYKYQAGEMQRMLWGRMNSRLGACVGALNGAAYLVLICLLIYNFTYWTVQMASDDDAGLIKLANRMGNDLKSSGAIKIARAADSMPQIYFRLADLAGLLYQNPALADRLANYPEFISLAERDELKQLGQDADFQNGWKNRSPVGALLKNPHAAAILQDDDLRNQIFQIVQTNLDDLTNYLQTGISQKFGLEKILGRWDFNVGVTVAMLRESQPNISSSQMQSVRTWMTKAYADTTFVAGADGQAFLKSLPQLKPGTPPTTDIATWTGSWAADGSNYDLTLTANGENKPMTGKIANDRLTLADDKNTWIFDRE